MKAWRISLKQGVVLIEFDDGTVVSPEMLLDTYRTLSADPEKYRSRNAVYDLRNIVPSDDAGFETALEIVKAFVALRQNGWEHKKTALVVSSKITYGLCRMYATLVEENLDYEARVFDKDLGAAIKWAQT